MVSTHFQPRSRNLEEDNFLTCKEQTQRVIPQVSFVWKTHYTGSAVGSPVCHIYMVKFFFLPLSQLLIKSYKNDVIEINVKFVCNIACDYKSTFKIHFCKLSEFCGFTHSTVVTAAASLYCNIKLLYMCTV